MKKIYILAAVFALLSLSLNAQELTDVYQGSNPNLKSVNMKGMIHHAGKFSFDNVLNDIKGMPGILAAGQARAPFRYNTDLFYTVGPFEGDNFDGGIGFPNAYPQVQDITIATMLQNSEYADHIGDEIIGFRFALYGDATKKVNVTDFIAWPYINGTGFDQSNQHTWTIADLEGNTAPTAKAPKKANRGYVLLNDDIDGTKFSTGSDVDNNLSAPWSATYLRNQSGNMFYIRANGSMVFTVPSGYSNAKFKFTFKTSTSYYDGYFDFTPSNGTAQRVTTSAASTEYDCEISGLSSGNTVTITGICTGYSYSPDFMYMYVYVDNGSSSGNVVQSQPICDGTATDTYLPFYGLYTDNYQINQMIYPESLLSEISGKTLTSMTFYANAALDAKLASGTWTIKLGTTNQTTFTSGSITRLVPSNIQAVVSGYHFTIGSNELTIDFATPFTYSGGNLLIDFEETAYNSDWKSATFYGVSQSGITGHHSHGTGSVGSNGLYSTSPTTRQFLPKVTFTYEDSSEPPVEDGLNAGQWHEFYLDEPVEFNVSNDNTHLMMGYTYTQYPSSNTTNILNPAAVNSQSTGHNHFAYMTTGSPSATNGDIVITVPSYNTMFYQIVVFDGETGNTLTTWNSNMSTTTSGNYTYYPLPTDWSHSSGGAYMFQSSVTLDDNQQINLGYCSSASQSAITIASSALNGKTNVGVYIFAAALDDGQSIDINGDTKTIESGTFAELEWDNIFGAAVTDWNNVTTSGDLAVQLIFKEGKTAPPTITGQVDPNDENYYVITATGDGTVTLTVGNQTVTGNGTASITIPRTDVDQTVTATATAQDGDLEVSDPTTEEFVVPKLVTASPTISITPGDAAYTITATGTGTVTLTIGDQTVTGNGTASITIPRTNVDQNITATATAQETGKAVSEPATQVITVPMLPITPTPEITYQVTNASVVITATGEGTVTLSAGGQTVSGEGTVSITIMRSIEDQTVTATATAVTTSHQPSAQDTESVLVPALTGTPATAKEGLLRMHLLVVDQFKEEIPDDNSHPERYGYVLKWEPNGPEGSGVKESGTVEVEIQKTEAQVNGYYTLDQIDADVNVGINHDLGLTMDVLTADASMFLPGENPDVLYYQMQGKEGTLPALNEDYLTQLQYMKNVKKYEEMLATSPNKTHQYPANDTYHYYDDSEPIVTGIYNDITSFMTYAPSVSTWGIQRRYFEVDHLDNTYGAPIWKTAVGQVKLNSAVHERQTNQWNSVNWKDEGGNDCSLYILDNIEAEGYLPHTGISNVEYEPYMFRVFVESKNGKLRPYTVVPQGDGDNDGEHLVAGTGTTTGPICVWSGYYMDGDVNGMTFSGPRASETVSGQMKYVFTKVKVDRSTDNVVNPWDDISDPWNDFDTITDPETGEIIKIVDTNRGKANAMFGALDNLAEIIGTDEQGRPVYAPVSEDDLKVFVRFYYVAAGTADGHVLNSRAGGASYPAGYGSESPGKAPSPWTTVQELRYHGEIVSQTYVNVQGMQSDRPFDGINIVITRYSDGTTSTAKVIR